MEPSQPHHSLSLCPETSRKGALRAETRLQEDSHPGKGGLQPLEGTEGHWLARRPFAQDHLRHFLSTLSVFMCGQ